MKLTRAVFELSKAELVALVAHASADKAKLNQTLLVLDPVEGRAHATDGHRLATVATDNPSTACPDLVSTHAAPRSLVPRDVADRLAKTKGCAYVRFFHGAGRAQVFDKFHDLKAEVPYIDCAAALEAAKTATPSIHLFLADQPHAEPATLAFAVNPRFLADLALVQGAIPGEPEGEFRTPDDELAPLVWRFGAWRVVMMLIRLPASSEPPENQRKAWARSLRAAKAPAKPAALRSRPQKPVGLQKYLDLGTPTLRLSLVLHTFAVTNAAGMTGHFDAPTEAVALDQWCGCWGYEDLAALWTDVAELAADGFGDWSDVVRPRVTVVATDAPIPADAELRFLAALQAA